MDKRRSYFDIAKGIGIILVVMGHLEYISIPTRYFIVSFHMPMFFVISGMLMYQTGEENKDWKSFLKGKLKRMGLPYLSYSILFLIVEVLYTNLTHTWDKWVFIQDIWYALSLYGISVLWFLPAMFFGMLLFFIIRKKLTHRASVIVIAVLTVTMYFVNQYLEYLKNLWIYEFLLSELYYFLAMIVRSFFAMFYLAAGYYGLFIYKRYIRERFSRAIAVASIPLAILLLASVAYLSQVNGAVDIHFMIFGNPAIYIYNSFAGSTAVILLSRMLENISQSVPCRILRYYGVNSLTVMATHINMYVLYVCIIVSMHFIKYVTRAKEYIFCTMILLFVFAAEFIIIEIVNRFFPILTGSLRGSRK